MFGGHTSDIQQTHRRTPDTTSCEHHISHLLDRGNDRLFADPDNTRYYVAIVVRSDNDECVWRHDGWSCRAVVPLAECWLRERRYVCARSWLSLRMTDGVSQLVWHESRPRVHRPWSVEPSRCCKFGAQWLLRADDSTRSSTFVY